MSFTFSPLTEEQLQQLNLMEEGIYNFEVIKATQKTSKSGNQMIELQLTVWDKEGKTHTIFDYLVSITSMIYKIKHFCDTVGLEAEYKAGNFDVNSCERKCGKAHIIIKPGQDNYPSKNAVKDYVIKDKDEVKPSNVKASNTFVDDDVPF